MREIQWPFGRFFFFFRQWKDGARCVDRNWLDRWWLSMRKHLFISCGRKSSRHHKSMTNKRWTINWTVANDCVMKLNIVRMHATTPTTTRRGRKKRSEIPLRLLPEIYTFQFVHALNLSCARFFLFVFRSLYSSQSVLYNKSQLFYSISARVRQTYADKKNKQKYTKSLSVGWTLCDVEKKKKTVC